MLEGAGNNVGRRLPRAGQILGVVFLVGVDHTADRNDFAVADSYGHLECMGLAPPLGKTIVRGYYLTVESFRDCPNQAIPHLSPFSVGRNAFCNAPSTVPIFLENSSVVNNIKLLEVSASE